MTIPRKGMPPALAVPTEILKPDKENADGGFKCYRAGSHLWLLLAEMVHEIAERILRRRIEERDNATIAAPGF